MTSTFWQEFFGSFSFDAYGFIFMIVILGMLVFAIAIAIERIYYVMVRSNVNADQFMVEIRKLVTSGTAEVIAPTEKLSLPRPDLPRPTV